MITDEQVRWIALFFLFTLMDERIAIHAAHKTVAHIKSTAENRGKTISRVVLLKAMRKQYQIHLKQLPKRVGNKPFVVPDMAWSLPDHVDVAPWTKFQKDANETEVAAVTLSQILSFTDHEIADGWSISLGTARYRVGKGVRQLGVVFEKTGKVRA